MTYDSSSIFKHFFCLGVMIQTQDKFVFLRTFPWLPPNSVRCGCDWPAPVPNLPAWLYRQASFHHHGKWFFGRHGNHGSWIQWVPRLQHELTACEDRWSVSSNPDRANAGSRLLRNMSIEEGKKLVAKAIRAGIFNDLGSGKLSVFCLPRLTQMTRISKAPWILRHFYPQRVSSCLELMPTIIFIWISWNCSGGNVDATWYQAVET